MDHPLPEMSIVFIYQMSGLYGHRRVPGEAIHQVDQDSPESRLGLLAGRSSVLTFPVASSVFPQMDDGVPRSF
jgi:hypothetical protein